MAERSVNKAILLGRLGGDAETRHTQNGTPVSRFSLAMNRQWTDSDQQVHEETEWIYIVLWNKENLATYLTKGTKVYVEGRIQTRSYEDDGGLKRYVTEVVAQNIVLLGSSGNVNGNGAERAEKSGNRPARASALRNVPIKRPIPKNRVSKMTCRSRLVGRPPFRPVCEQLLNPSRQGRMYRSLRLSERPTGPVFQDPGVLSFLISENDWKPPPNERFGCIAAKRPSETCLAKAKRRGWSHLSERRVRQTTDC